MHIGAEWSLQECMPVIVVFLFTVPDSKYQRIKQWGRKLCFLSKTPIKAHQHLTMSFRVHTCPSVSFWEKNRSSTKCAENVATGNLHYQEVAKQSWNRYCFVLQKKDIKTWGITLWIIIVPIEEIKTNGDT